MADAPLIGISGHIGVGKSTILPGLASVLGLCPRLERVATNPFFERYVSDRASWGFWTQLSFITGAIDSASVARQSGGGVLERPAEEVLGVFARDLHRIGLIDDRELWTLERVAAIGEQLVGPPDLLIVLHGDPVELLARLKDRGDPGDDSYDLCDMRRLAGAYDQWRATLDDDRVIDVDVGEVDLRTPAALVDLAARAKSALGLLR